MDGTNMDPFFPHPPSPSPASANSPSRRQTSSSSVVYKVYMVAAGAYPVDLKPVPRAPSMIHCSRMELILIYF